MTTPIDPDTRIAELRKKFSASAVSYGGAGEAVYGELEALASELAEKLRESEAERYAAIKEMAKARDKAMEAQGDRDVDRILGLEYADGREGAFRAVYDKARELEGANLLNRSAIRNLQTGLAETKRELEQERELRSAADAKVSRQTELLGVLDDLASLVIECDSHLNPRQKLDARDLFRKRAELIVADIVADNKAPPLPACKRCGKPVAHPAQEYCGAACSVERGRAVEQPDDRGGEGETVTFPALPTDPNDERIVDELMAKRDAGRTERKYESVQGAPCRCEHGGFYGHAQNCPHVLGAFNRPAAKCPECNGEGGDGGFAPGIGWEFPCESCKGSGRKAREGSE